jgi:hypothetical protein
MAIELEFECPDKSSVIVTLGKSKIALPGRSCRGWRALESRSSAALTKEQLAAVDDLEMEHLDDDLIPVDRETDRRDGADRAC